MGRGRPPKCKICGKTLKVETAYMVITCNKNGTEKKAFYCSQEEFESINAAQSKGINKVKKETKQETKSSVDKDVAYRLICDIMGKQKITNSILWKEWAIWNGITSDEIVRKYLEENKTYLTGRIARLDNVEYSRIRYLSAILKNSLADFKPKQENLFSLNIPAEYYETKYKPKVRVALLDIEEECYE